jgi:DNA repair protein RecO (recombination protein O)
MLITTKAIVLSAIKFQDSSLIVKCYTSHGIKSYLLKGILKSKSKKLKPAYFQVFTLLDLVANHNNKGRLNYIKEASVYKPFHSIYTNIYKSTIALFLSEILTNVLKEEEENFNLFNFIEKALIWLDTNDKISNFHLLFLLDLTKYLGFYPKINHNDALFFNLKQGVFTNSKPMVSYITNENLTLLKSIIGINFDAISFLKINVKNRQSFLLFLIDYFKLHLPEFNKPKSLAVLQTVFR